MMMERWRLYSHGWILPERLVNCLVLTALCLPQIIIAVYYLGLPVDFDVAVYLEGMPRWLRFTTLYSIHAVVRLCGPDPVILRLLNLVVHCLAVFLTYLFLRRLTGRFFPAFFATLALSVWPCAAITLGFISQIGQPILVSSLMAGMLLLRLRPDTPSLPRGAAAAGLALVALFSWENGPISLFCLPLVLLNTRHHRRIILAGLITAGGGGLVMVIWPQLFHHLLESVHALTVASTWRLLLAILERSGLLGGHWNPVIWVVALSGIAAFFIPSVRRRLDLGIVLLLLGLSAVLFISGLIPLLFRVPVTDMEKYTHIGAKHIYFMGYVMTFLLAAGLYIIDSAVRTEWRRRLMYGIAAVLILLTFNRPILEGHRAVVQCFSLPFKAALEAVRPAIDRVPHHGHIHFRLAADFMADQPTRTVTRKRLEAYVTNLLKRRDVRLFLFQDPEATPPGYPPADLIVFGRSMTDFRIVPAPATVQDTMAPARPDRPSRPLMVQ
ncbi:hypothetical protein JW905_01835 [bacterium]|nr:hypothetical protein [candidate division CSSED10-310 bacterium]